MPILANLTHSFYCIAKYTKKHAPGHPSSAGLHQTSCRARLALLGDAAHGRGRERKVEGDKGGLQATSRPLFFCCSSSSRGKCHALCPSEMAQSSLEECVLWDLLSAPPASGMLLCWVFMEACTRQPVVMLCSAHPRESAVTNTAIVCLTYGKNSVVYN